MFTSLMSKNMPSNSKRQKVKSKDSNPYIVKVEKDYTTLFLIDALCPICKTIMLDPVTLPCNHNFCLCCFDDTMKTANLVCPLCQIRVGSWWRKALKEGKHINKDLRRAINGRFPRRLYNKLSGIEEDEPKKHVISELEGKSNEVIEENHIELQQIVKKEVEGGEQLIKGIKEESNHQEILSDMEQQISPTKEMDKFALKEYVCRIFPLEKKQERHNIFSPFSMTAKQIQARDNLTRIQDDEKFHKAAREEKLRLESLLLNKLAPMNIFTWPPLVAMPEKLSPMVKYYKPGFKPVEPHIMEPKENVDFALKEYTCEALNMKKPVSDNDFMKLYSSIIAPSAYRVQVLVERHTDWEISEHTRDKCSKYAFHNMRKYIKKEPQTKKSKNVASDVLSPIRSTDYFSRSSTVIKNPLTTASNIRSSGIEDISILKRFDSEDKSDHWSEPFLGFDNSQGKGHERIAIKTCKNESFESDGPFYGFKNSSVKDEQMETTSCKFENDDHEQKALQEKFDLDYAMKIQKNLNKHHETRGAYRIHDTMGIYKDCDTMEPYLGIKYLKSKGKLKQKLLLEQPRENSIRDTRGVYKDCDTREPYMEMKSCKLEDELEQKVTQEKPLETIGHYRSRDTKVVYKDCDTREPNMEIKSCKLENEFEQKSLQEKLDLEFAMKLQKNLNKPHETRGAYRIHGTRRVHKDWDTRKVHMVTHFKRKFL